MKKGFILLVLLIGTGVGVFGQNRFWVAGSPGNWNDPANWSTTSGGAGGASVPGAGNTPVFDANGLGNCNLDVAPTVAGITVNGYTGTIDLIGNNLTTTGINLFTTGTISNSGGAAEVTLNTTGTTTFNGTLFNANINGSTGRLFLSGSTFNGTVSITKTDNNTDTGTGGNAFNNSLVISHLGTGELRLGNTNPDIFSSLTINVNNTGDVSVSRTSAGNILNENTTVNYNSTGDLFFGANGGTTTLQPGKTITVGSIGAGGSGNLSLAQFTQSGATAQNITLSGNNTSTLTVGPASSFAASLTVVAPSIILNSSSFQALTLTKTGTVTSGIRGGNTFNGIFVVNNQGGDMLFGSNPADAGDTWHANATFNNSGGYRIRIPEETTGNIFNADATFNNTAVTDIQSRIQVARLTGAEVTFNGTTAFFNNGNASDIHISYDVGTSTTFNGPVVYTNSATTSAADNFIGVNGNVSFASDLQITNNTSDNIYLSGGTGTVTFGNGTITVGAFAAGSLRFRNFTQTGATAQTFSLTGTAALYLGPASTFNGGVNFSAPQLYLNGSTYGGTAILEKTGATSNAGTGGNIFNGPATLTNSGSGYLMTGNGTRDQFFSTATFNNTGSYRVHVAYNHPGQTTTFASTVTLNSNKSGAGDAWSFFFGEVGASAFSVAGDFIINCLGAIQSNNRILNGTGSSALYSGNVTINLSNTHTGTTIYMGENGTSTYSGNISVSNSAASGVTFNTNSTASSTLSGTISAGTFSTGTLNLYRFTQVGAVAQSLTLTSTALLRIGPNSSFDGQVTFTSPRLLLHGATYNGITYLEKTGATDDAGNGGNTFNNTTDLLNSGSGYFMTGNTSPDIFNGPLTVTNTSSSFIYLAYNSPGNQFNNSIEVNNTGSALGVSFSENALGYSLLSAGNTISEGGSGFTTGQLRLYRFSQDGATPQNLNLSGTALLRLGPSSEFDGDVTFVSPRVLLNGTTYNGSAYIEKSSTTADDGIGGNIFNGTTEIVNSGDSYLRTSLTTPDIFNGLLILTNNGASTIRMADNAAGNQFNGNIELNSTFGGGIYFSNTAAGTSTLAAGRTISVGSSGVISGDIRLIRFTQVGSTLQTLDLSGIAILTLGPTSSFGGDVNFKAPQLYLNGTTFSSTAYLEKEGATDNPSTGGNTFNGTTSIVDSGSGYLLTASTTPDIFNGNLTVTNTGSNAIYLAYAATGSQFNGDITFNSTLGSGGISFAQTATGDATLGNGASLNVGGLGFSSGNLRLRRFTQVGAAAQNLVLTGTALLEIGPSSTFNGNVDFRAPQFELDGCTYNGTTYLEKTGATNNSSNGGNDFNGTTTIANSGSGYFRFAVTTLDTFDGDLILTNTGTSSILMADVVPGSVFNGNIEVNCTSGVGIYFGDNPPADATLASGRTISVGAGGFTIGELRLDRFVQLGATPQTLLLTGTAQLTVGPSTQFNGDVDFRSPQLFLSGGTFNGSAYLEKTGATNNTGSGSNTFNGITAIRNSGSGVLRTNGGNTFNGTTSITNAGTADILLELTTASTYNSDVTFTNANTSTVRVAYIGANTFNGNILVNSTAGNGILFCENAAGSASLSNGQTIAVGGTGFTAGELRLQRFTQTGTTAQSLALTGTSTFRTGSSSTWNGDLTVSAPALFLDGAALNGTTNLLTKTGATTDNSVGGNTFNGNTTFTNSGAGIFRFGVTTADTYNGSTIFARSNGTIQPAYNNINVVYGDLTTNSTTAITFGANTGSLSFEGGVAQSLNKVAGVSPVITRMNMNKSANALTLNTDATISVNGTFTSGIINTTAANYLNFADNATVTGGVDASYVDGPVRKTGNDAFTFPVGDNGFYRPTSISAPTGTAHHFTAQYFNANHNLGSPAVWDPTFWTVTGCEYWTVDRNAGPASDVFVTLSWNESACNAGYVTNPADLRVTRWNGTNWVDHGNGGTTGIPANGTVISSAAITSFSPITLASVSAANPLPIELAWFRASIIDTDLVKLQWHTDSELNNESFDIERSHNGFDYSLVGNLQGAGTTSQPKDYVFIDEQPLSGRSYYRLKQNDFGGDFSYSHIVSVVFEETNEPFSVHPNPAGKEWVTFNRKVNATVINNLNQVVGTYSEVTGFNTSELAAGIYTIRTHRGEVFRLVIK